MESGAFALFENATTFFQFMIGVSYFNTVLLFVIFFLVLHVAAKLIKQK